MSPPPASDRATNLHLHPARVLGLLAVLSAALHVWGLDLWESPAMAWFARFGAHAAGCLALAVALRLALDVPRASSLAAQLLGINTAPAPVEATASWRAAGAGAVTVTALGLAVAELRTPYYFAQDDNLMQFMPVVVHGCESLFRGTFPAWNPHQMMGAPTASVGTYALTYPVTWLAYAVARWVLGNPYLFCDVFCAAHLLAGAWATVWALRQAGVRPGLAAAGATSFALSGYFLVTGRSWFYMTPVAAWVPLLFGLIERARRREPGPREALSLALAVGALFHAGNAQMWLYSLLLGASTVAVLAAAGELAPARVLRLAGGALLGVALAAPLLVPQLDVVRDVRRAGAIGIGIGEALPHLALPHGLGPSEPANLWGALPDDVRYMNTAYYGGTLFMGAGLALLLLLLVVRWSRALVRANPWLLAGGIALLFALGNEGVLWALFAHLPVFNKLQLPYKFLPLVTLLLVFAAGASLERALPRRGRLAPSLVAASLALMVYHASTARSSHCSFPDRPYPAPPGAVLRPLRGHGTDARRVFTLAPSRSSVPGYLAALPHNVATVYGAFALHGYDPLVAGAPPYRRLLESQLYDHAMVLPLRVPYSPLLPGYAPVDALRALGVRWVLVHRTSYTPQWHRESLMFRLESLDAAGRRQRDVLVAASTPVVTEGDFQLRELAGAAPLAFAEGAPSAPLDVRFDAAGASVALPAAASGRIIVNVLARPHLVAAVDGRPAATSPDAWGRLAVRVPPGARSLRVDYRPPWGRGFAAGFALAAVAAALLARTRRS